MSEIDKIIDEFIVMKPGELISDPSGIIPIGDRAQFSRRSLKHFVESRLRGGSTRKDILYLVEKAPEVINTPQLHVPNPNTTYPGSSLLGRFYQVVQKAVIVILDRDKEVRDIISLHFKNKVDFEKLLELYRKQ